MPSLANLVIYAKLVRMIFDAVSDNQMETDSHKIDHLNRLKDLNIDLTAYMTTQQPPPVSDEYQLVSPVGTSTSTVM